MASWKAPELDFEAPRRDFLKIFADFWNASSNSLPSHVQHHRMTNVVQNSCLGGPSFGPFTLSAGFAHSELFYPLLLPEVFQQKERLPARTIPPLIPPTVSPPVHHIDAIGRRRCPPSGAFNPPPTEGGAGRARYTMLLQGLLLC